MQNCIQTNQFLAKPMHCILLSQENKLITLENIWLLQVVNFGYHFQHLIDLLPKRNVCIQTQTKGSRPIFTCHSLIFRVHFWFSMQITIYEGDWFHYLYLI